MRAIETLQFQNWPVRIERIPNRRSISVYLKPQLPIIVRVGIGFPQNKIIEFLFSKQTWIEKNMLKFIADEKKHPPRPLRQGTVFPIRGKEHLLIVTPTPNKKAFISFVEQQIKLHIPLNEWDANAKSELHQDHLRLILLFYQKQAVEYISSRVHHWSNQMNLFPKQVKFRSQKTRWGSCSSHKVINLNWRLIVFQPEIIDYVVIHELSHLKYMNHSRSFWQLVEQFQPTYMIYRRRLKEMQNLPLFLDQYLIP